jgi:hypothetical protein
VIAFRRSFGNLSTSPAKAGASWGDADMDEQSPGKKEGFVLHPHPDFPSTAIQSISVDVATGNGSLSLTYHVTGATGEVLWPPLGPGGRGDRLWEHSCFEAFIGRAGEAGYTELNLATSGQWAAYDFDAYRVGMRAVEGMWFALSFSFEPDMIEFSASTHLPILSFGREWQLGLSAIIEDRNGAKSYWALAHVPGPPDFHNRDCFTARLAAPNAA